MIDKVLATMLIIVAAIHFLPVVGIVSAHSLEKLYGIKLEDGNLTVLLQHRAALFALLGMSFVFAAFRQQYANIAIGAGAVSVVSFLVIAKTAPNLNEALTRVVVADWVALTALGVAAICQAIRS